MSAASVDVVCRQEGSGGWGCTVTVRDDGRSWTYDVGVARGDLARLDPGSIDPTDLVRRSFAFLLEREPPSSILRTFDLPVIGRYFPEYEAAIRGSR